MTDVATERKQQDTHTRVALGALLLPLFFAAMFALCIVGTYHTPHPNHIKLGVVGPTAQTAPLRAGFEKAGLSAFVISPAGSVAEAARAVRERDLNAAYVPTASREQPATVIVASANGRLMAKATEDFVRAASAAQRAQLAVRDVRPLAPGGALSIGIFMFLIVLTIAGYLAVTVLETVARTCRPAAAIP
jgi:hypothetical protein